MQTNNIQIVSEFWLGNNDMILNNMLPDINTQVVFDGTAYLI